MNKLDIQTRALVIGCLVEGNSLRSTVRMTGVSMPTILKLLVDLGEVCREYQDKAFRNLACRRLQMDEVWQYCYAKEKNVPEGKKGTFGHGDVWVWVAIDAEYKARPILACWPPRFNLRYRVCK